MAPGSTVCQHCGRAHYGAVCQACQQPAPTLVRGGQVVCSGCGATRGPLSGVPLNMVGTAHKVGGVVASVAGWAIVAAGLALGGIVGLTVGMIAQIFAVSALWGVGIGAVIGAMSALVGMLLLRGGKSLKERGQKAKDEATEQSILAMAASRRGAVMTLEVSQNLAIPLAEADRLLTEMSQRGRALVEINRDGLLQYTFRDVRGALDVMAAQTGAPTGVRVDVGGAPATPAEAAKAQVDREFEAMTERHRAGRF